ncbi:cofactor-independent phosphoglycerate mutase [Acetatifactor muris]|uniref:Cofactor-independent phosphoglycerate mutase n=1 Tax=Acetatifactor muris TaxID=879566 RepID=A0A2K4ZCE1_9FIRM|nr:cofactor-independent phosphoglycerate mutase [Acetatifactor muris]MCR2046307.1 cofactor-independent phosphoglycerate mutase [Acetatifactor muris]SOY28125.1 cofactor-independent phosphoglycerate mutase [Acetatifactor muris]
MKYIVVLGDGMADEPIAALENKTPLAWAKTPNLDRLSRLSELGMVHTIPGGMKPGSDTANLAVLGYNPEKYYSGRSPLEALSIGVPMKDTDIAVRCNIVTLSEEEGPFGEKRIIDHSSSEISTEDCAVLLREVERQLADETYQFYVGTSYRHCLIWNRGKVVELTPPHDILGQKIGQYLPEDEVLREMTEKSYHILVNHPLNLERKKKGLNPANCCWFWGAGTKPALTSFQEKTGKKGMMVSAVDLLKGIAVGAGMGVACVEGANGGLYTNYAGKVEAAVNALTRQGYDFAYIHLEAPDEMGHQGNAEKKVQAIEFLDGKVIGPLVEKMEDAGEAFRLLVLPDHPTPVRVRTHTSESVPYMLYDSTSLRRHEQSYNEEECRKTGNFVASGYRLIDKFLAV